MALARIVTRSHEYAQQLALDLLARGYAVEIVSPDATPTHPADLELRVETSDAEAQGQVTEIREHGKPSKSIEYLQRLKPMMADLLRRWPSSAAETGKDIEEKSSAFSFNAEPAFLDDMELPSADGESSATPTHIEAPEFTDPQPEFVESAQAISQAGAEKPISASPSVFSITGEPIVWTESESERSRRSEVWFWRAAVGFASLALVILVLGMALRRNPSVAAQPASPLATPPLAAAGTQTMAATVSPTPAKATVPSPAASPSPLQAKPASAVATPVNSIPKAKPSAIIHRAGVGHNDEVVNGDTTVTYFNSKAAEPPKPVSNQGSGIKHYSDMD
jgi:hypothetical protein